MVLLQPALSQAFPLKLFRYFFQDDVGNGFVPDIIHQQHGIYLVLLHDLSSQPAQDHVDPLADKPCPDQSDDQGRNRKGNHDSYENVVNLGRFQGEKNIDESRHDRHVEDVSEEHGHLSKPSTHF